MSHFPPPSLRCRPGRGIGFDGVGAAVEQQSYYLGPAPTAGPAERGTVQQIVAHVQARACIDKQLGKSQGFVGRHGFIERGDVVEYGPPNSWMADVGAATFQNLPEAFQVQTLILFRSIVVAWQRRP